MRNPSRNVLLVSLGHSISLRDFGRSLASQWNLLGPLLLWDTTSSWEDPQRLQRLPSIVQTLSGEWLRNYLASRESYAEILGDTEMNSADVRGALQDAFSSVLFLAEACWNTQFLALMDQANLVVALTPALSDSQAALEEFVDRLISHKYPRHLLRIVTDQKTSAGPPEPSSSLLLSKISAPGSNAAFHALATLLQTDASLYSGHQAVEHEETVATKNKLHRQLLESATPHDAPAPDEARATLEKLLSRERTLPASRELREQVYQDLVNDVLGLGPLEPLLRDAEISEIMVNGPKNIFIEKKGRLSVSPAVFESETQLRTAIDRIVGPIGRRVDESTPLCDARLSDGSRVNIILPPLALDGPTVTIRKFMNQRLSLEDLLGFKSLNKAMADYLRAVVRDRQNIVVSGGTGSGKTTLLNILSGLIAPEERIVTIEDAAELRLHQPHVVRLESRPANAEGEGAIAIRRLVMNALRMRPDRIIVGECRGGEALDMLQAMNTGHDGSMTTVHANTARDALGRIEALVLMAGIELPVRVVREQIRSALDVIVQIARLADGSRKIVSITEITGMEGDVLTTAELYRWKDGAFEATGLANAPLFS
jgi:pilus assembly protein CpaF